MKLSPQEIPKKALFFRRENTLKDLYSSGCCARLEAGGQNARRPDWAHNLWVHRCRGCGRYWYRSYEQYAVAYYTSSHPLAGQPGDLLRPGAGADALFTFLDGQGTRQADGFEVAHSYLLRAPFDFGEVLRGLIVRLPLSGDEETVSRSSRSLEAVLIGESGRLVWLAAPRGSHGLPLPRASLDALYAALDRLDGDSRPVAGDRPRLLVEVHRRLARWRTPR